MSRLGLRQGRSECYQHEQIWRLVVTNKMSILIESQASPKKSKVLKPTFGFPFAFYKHFHIKNKYKICMGIFAGNILKSKWEYESVSIKTSTNSEMAQLPSKYICLPHIGHSSWNSKATHNLTLNISFEKLCDLVPFHSLSHIQRVSVNLCSRLEKALREFMYLSSYQKPPFPL